jgi:myo-inositol-1(or 4)-monophosphatase
MQSSDLLDVASSAARAAVDVPRSHLGRVDVSDWSEKGAADFVTFVDREAEACIVERVRAAFPDHAILAEEEATAAADGAGIGAGTDGYEWINDPLDGTTNFLHRYPMYTASVAVTLAGQPVAGVVIDSVAGVEWYATKGGGAFRDGEPIRVSAIDTLRQSLIGTGFPFKALHLLPAYLKQFDGVLRSSAGIRRAGSAALDLCHVAAGYFDGFWELALAPWDIAAGTLIVREAGGCVSRVDGGPLELRTAGNLLAGNAAIHAALGEVVRARANENEG